MDLVLRCTGGPCAGETITIESELTLGREEPDPGRLGGDSRLSRRHARLFVDDDRRCVVEDLGSTNGTWVNDQRLADARVLASGDVLRVGQTTFEIELAVVEAKTKADTIAPSIVPTVPETAMPMPCLRVLAGPKQGEEIQLGAELLIGRSYGEPGALGGDRRLSRRHARIARGPGGVFFIEDTGSSNGTTFNHAALRRAHSLKDGDEIEVGSTRLQPQGLPRVPLAVELDDHTADRVSPAAAPAAVGSPAAAPSPAEPAAAPPAPRQPAAVPLAAAPQAVPAGDRPAPYVPQGASQARLSSRRGRVIGVFAAVFALAAIAAVAVVVLVEPLGTKTCPSGFVCQKPPTAPPLRALRTFTGSLGWRVEYDQQTVSPAKADAAANELSLNESTSFDRHTQANPGKPIIAVLIRGYRSSQVSPQAAVQKLADDLKSNLVGTVTAPSSDQFFVRPVLGFHPAVGEVLEGNALTPQGPGPLFKLAILSAASGGVTVVLGIAYPVQLGQSQGSNPDRPFDTFGDQILGTVRFPSDGAA